MLVRQNSDFAAGKGHQVSTSRDEVLLDKIWRCTVDEDEKGISLDKPGPEFFSHLQVRIQHLFFLRLLT